MIARLTTLARLARVGLGLSTPRHVRAHPPRWPPMIAYGRPTMSDSSLSAHHKLIEEGIPADIDEAQMSKLIEHANSVWAAPPRMPKGGWSSSWEHWPYLLTFYWSSSYFLMIPQIEMITNIQYHLPGETRPLLFSNLRHQFVFTLYQEPTRFFLYDVEKRTLHEFENVVSEEELVQKMDEDPDVLPLCVLPPDAEGESAIQRIMDRDETVIPLLAERFLDYTPQVTQPWQENPAEGEVVTQEDKDEIRVLISEKVEKALDGGKTELTEEEQWNVVKEVAVELDRRGSPSR
ncbi:hypothetical protein APHAL10511_005143 [Amanita phalloides]|nr:hypothetical protein APHAL10511_005143 [Amanita phalloides]